MAMCGLIVGYILDIPREKSKINHCHVQMSSIMAHVDSGYRHCLWAIYNLYIRIAPTYVHSTIYISGYT